MSLREKIQTHLEYRRTLKNSYSYLGPEVSGAEESNKRVPNKHELVRRHNETLPPGHKNPWRLVSLNATEKGVDGVGQGGEVSQALG